MSLLFKKISFYFAVLTIFYNAEAIAKVVDGSSIMDQEMSENLCAITFDDGPAPNTPVLLDLLAAYEVPATFFLLGQNVMLYPELVERMLAEGHEVANHSWSHPNLKKLSFDSQTAQIASTDRLLRSLGATPYFMRPPYGSFDEKTKKVAENLGLSIILWSLDSKDWKKSPEDYSRLGSTRGTIYEAGDLHGIFLFHDTHRSTVEDLPKIVEDLKAGGCDKFVTVSEYLQGIKDPEPGSLMTRRPVRSFRNLAEKKEWLKFSAGSGPIPLARSSKPWLEEKETFDLEDAQAAIGHSGKGI